MSPEQKQKLETINLRLLNEKLDNIPDLSGGLKKSTSTRLSNSEKISYTSWSSKKVYDAHLNSNSNDSN